MADFWPHLHDDPFSLERLKRSCEMLQCAHHHSVLDVGCHHKEALKFLPPHVEYTGLDILQGDDFDGGFQLNHKFDRILCLEVLEHLKFPRRTLLSIAQHLTDPGIAVISLPNESSIFHRIRSLFGTVDQECFSEDGKHLHLPSFRQASSFVSEYLEIQTVEFYVSSGCGTRQNWIRPILKRTPKSLLKCLADISPSLFSRGFIFQLKKKKQ